MIVDRLSCFKTYIKLHKNFSMISNFMKLNTLNTLEEGHHIISGESVFLSINRYETQTNKNFEAHKQYIDLQIVLEGNEYIKWCPLSETCPITNYDIHKDITFLTGKGQKFLATQDLFFIFFPEDAHQPGITFESPKYVKKAVFKIKI